MKKIFLLNIFIISTLSAQKLTLNEAIKLGLDNRIELKTQNLQIKLTESENLKAKAKWLPQINATADARVNTQLQTSILPFDITGQNPGESSEVRFGLPYSNSFGIQADQKIFDANKKIDVLLNNSQTDVQKNLLEQQKNTIRQVITEAYYSVIYNKEKLDFNQKTIKRVEENQANAAVKLKNGTMLQNDFDRYLLDVKNASISYKKALIDYESSLENLKYRMHLQSNQPIEISEDLTTLLKSNETLFRPDFEQRTEIKLEEINLKFNDLNQQKQKFSNYPTVSAYGNYTLLQQINVPNPFKKGSVFPFNYLGLRVNIPVFDGKKSKIFSNDFAIKQEINLQNIEKLKEDFEYNTINALKQIDQAKLSLIDTKQNIDLAQQILKTDLFRYEKGVLSFAEVKNTESSLQNAETNYLSSIYNFLVASINYKKASGFFESAQ